MAPPPYTPLEKPAPVPVLTPEQILLGPRLTPLDYVYSYSDEAFERFIQEWAYYYLQEQSGLYVRVARIGGSGDLGRDVLGYTVDPPSNSTFDVYQCKHYASPLTPGAFWPELGKLCYHTFTATTLMPRRYYIVAPRDLGPTLASLIDAPSKLCDELLSVWEEKCAPLFNPAAVLTTPGLRAYLEDFDFGIVRHKPILELINELRKTPCFAPRFGGGLTLPPPLDPMPPDQIADHEQRYVEQLIEAYRDKLGDLSFGIPQIPSIAQLRNHFNRSRERFYSAEALQRFARDALAGGPGFQDIQEQVFDFVVELAENDFANGFERLNAVTDKAAQTPVLNHPLRSYIKSKSLKGVCHQLANEDKLKWVP